MFPISTAKKTLYATTRLSKQKPMAVVLIFVTFVHCCVTERLITRACGLGPDRSKAPAFVQCFDSQNYLRRRGTGEFHLLFLLTDTINPWQEPLRGRSRRSQNGWAARRGTGTLIDGKPPFMRKISPLSMCLLSRTHRFSSPIGQLGFGKTSYVLVEPLCLIPCQSIRGDWSSSPPG